MTSSVKMSSLIETPAILKEDSPKEWDIPFVNCVLLVTTDFDFIEIFHKIKAIEKQMGRNFRSPRWSPRIIDIDILVFNNVIYDSEDLQIPHPQLHKRGFVLQPLCEIFPDFVHPVFNKTFQELYKTLCNESL